MKRVFKILLMAAVFGLLSCSSDKDDTSKYLAMDIGSGNGVILPAPATTQSCQQLSVGEAAATGAITGAYFTLPNPVFTWTGPSPELSEVRVVVLKLTLKSPKVGGEYSCLFSDTALGSMYFKRIPIGDTTETLIWDGILGKTTASVRNSTQELITGSAFTACTLRCGGLTLPENAGQFTVTGIWEVLAVEKKYKSANSTDYDEFPIKIQGDFSVQSILN